MVRKIRLFLILLCSLVYVLSAETTTVKISLPNTVVDDYGQAEVAAGVPFDLHVSIENGDRNTKLEEILNIDKLQVLSRSNMSNFSMVNGGFASTITHAFQVVATNKGTLAIGPATAKQQDKKITSNIITLKIGDAAQAKKTSPQSEQSKKQADLQQEEPILFCELATDKKEYFIGEPIILTLNVYRNDLILQQGIAPLQMPAFTIKDLEQSSTQTVEKHGITYQLSQKKYLLIPKQTGEKTIDPIQVVYAAETKRQRRGGFTDDFFADFFGARVKEYATKSNALTLTIKNLPAHQPAADGVGVFTDYSARVDKNNTLVNEPIKLSLAIIGKGNFDQIAEPLLQLPKGIKFYKSHTDLKEDFTQGYRPSTKLFEYILQPSHAGNITIPAQRFIYFDPEIKQYKTLTTEEISLNVAAREGSPVAPNIHTPTLTTNESSDQSNHHEPTKEDIAFIEESGSAHYRAILEIPWYIFLILLLIPCCLSINIIEIIKKFIPTALAKQHAEQKLLQKYKQEFELLERHQNTKGLYAFMLTFISNYYKVEPSLITELWIIEHFPRYGWTVEKTDELIAFLNECASLNFVTTDKVTHQSEQLFKKAQYWMLFIAK